MWRANELGSEDQDLGRGKDIIDRNPTSPKTREKWGTLSLFIDEKWATRLRSTMSRSGL
jgi:hypothetical protein